MFSETKMDKMDFFLVVFFIPWATIVLVKFQRYVHVL